MSKKTVDVEYIKENLTKIGYKISDCDEKLIMANFGNWSFQILTQ